MKLIKKINRSYLAYGAILFLLADFGVVFVFTFHEKYENRKELKQGHDKIVNLVIQNGHIPDVLPLFSIKKLATNDFVEYRKDTVMRCVFDDCYETLLEYSKSVEIDGSNYLISFRKRKHSPLGFFAQATPVITSVLLIIIGMMFFLISRINRKIFDKFHHNISLLQNYSFARNSKLELEKTDIDEFDVLNNALMKMSARLEQDYEASKEFAANAAHELQTPLAIVRNKCELLLSTPNCPEEIGEGIEDIFVTTDRLSATTKALLLLAKIDHGQFDEDEPVSIKEIIELKLNLFSEIIDDKQIEIEIDEVDDCIHQLDKRLITIFIQNLIVNAIRYSPAGATIKFCLTKDRFSIQNYGETAIDNPNDIYNRFCKGENGATGIGLAIVKKIAEHYNIAIDYEFVSKQHVFGFSFSCRGNIC